MTLKPNRKKLEKCNPPVRFKKIIVELLRSGLRTQHELIAHYGFTRNQLRKWNRWYYDYQLNPNRYKESMKIKTTSNTPSISKKTTSKQAKKQISALHDKLAELEKLLENEKLKSKVLDKMITISEKKFNIAIRKKYGSKQ
jgi:hypothetical protein